MTSRALHQMTEAEWKDEIERRDEIIASYEYLTDVLREYENSFLARLGLRISRLFAPTPLSEGRE